MQDARGGTVRGESPLAIVEVDAALAVTGWNGRAERMFGATRAAALGRPVAGLIAAPDGPDGWAAVLREDDGAARSRVGGRAVEWLHEVLYDAAGAVAGARCYGRDVTARVADEARRALDELALRAMLDHLTLSVWTIDRRGEFVYMRGRAGVDASSLGKNVFDLYGDNPGSAQLRRAIAGEGQHNHAEADGRCFESWMIPVAHTRDGEPAVVTVSLDITDIKRGELEMRDKLELIERQQRVIRELGTPIIEVWDGVLTLPIIGLVDSVRTAEIMDNLLQSVVRTRARFAILDMTGVEVVDTSTASHLLGMIKAIRLLGAEGIITGIHPGIAQTIVALGVDLRSITVHASLREALKHCIARMARR